MKETIPWRRVLVEGAVIIFSILLALGADATWEDRQDRLAERDALRSLEEDFSANVDRIRAAIATHETSATLVARLQSMSPDDVRSLPLDSIDLYARAIGVPHAFSARDGTLDALIASGSLELIADARLREALVEWRTLVAGGEVEARNLRAVTELMVGRESELGGPWRRVRPTEGRETGLAEATRHYPQADLVAATSDVEYMRLARWKQLNAAVYLIQLRALEAHAEGVLTMLGTEG